MGRTTHSLTVSFTGIYGYDADGFATDRYEFVLRGAAAADGAVAALAAAEYVAGKG